MAMGVASTSDVELVSRVQAGQLDAFAAIVKRYESLVRAVSYSTTGRQELSDDIAQETFLTAWRSVSSVKDATKLRPWLCGIARNLGLQALRRTGRETEWNEDVPVETAPSPLDDMSAREADAAVWQVLEQVPERYRLPLVLHYKEGLDVGAIAESMGLSRVAVQQRLSRGRRALKGGISKLVEGTLARGKPSAGLVTVVVGAIAAGATSSAHATPSFAAATTTAENALWGKRGWTMTTKIALATMLAAATATTAIALGASSSSSDGDETATAPVRRTSAAAGSSDDPAPAKRGEPRADQERSAITDDDAVAGRAPTAAMSQLSVSLEEVQGAKLEAAVGSRFGDFLGVVEQCFDALAQRRPDLRTSDIAIAVDVQWKNDAGLGGIVVSSDVVGARGLEPDDAFDACVRESTFALDLDEDLSEAASATVIVRQNDAAAITARYLARRLSPSAMTRCTDGAGLQGPAVVSLDVDAAGSVVRTDVLGVDRESARRCVADIIQSIVFPRPRGPYGQMRVRYPLSR